MPQRSSSLPSRQAASTQRKVAGRWLPREGALPGGGNISVSDHQRLARLVQRAEEPRLATSDSSGSLSSASPIKNHVLDEKARATWQAGTHPPKGEMGAKRWKHRCLSMKHEMLDALRQQDQKHISEKVAHHKELRDERFERLMNATFSGFQPVLEASTVLRQHQVSEVQRKRDLHAAWGEHVYQPLETQILDHLNPVTQALERNASSPTIAGDFAKRPPTRFRQHHEPFRVQVHVEDDPTWKQIADHTWEESFDREATAVLDGLNASAKLRAAALDDASRGLSPARARSRPVLDPTLWGQLRLQATLYGRFPQVVEEGPDARMGKRGAPKICPPDESDGMLAAGKRSIRAGPHAIQHNDTGMLRGDGSAWNGQAFLSRTWHGASSGAPMQDHYTFAIGSAATDVEFPIGKRLVPHFP